MLSAPMPWYKACSSLMNPKRMRPPKGKTEQEDLLTNVILRTLSTQLKRKKIARKKRNANKS